jgi:hypothetical protein
MWDLACSSLHVMQQILKGKLIKNIRWVYMHLICHHHDCNLGGIWKDGVII